MVFDGAGFGDLLAIMFELLPHLTSAFMLYLVMGVFVGIVFGAIPGMTATMAVAVCLPFTYSLDLNEGVVLLLGLYVGGISGGLIPAILLNIPGTPSSITTTFDGFPLAQQGKGVIALRTSIIASLVGGMISALLLFVFAPILSDIAIKFSYVEKFLIILLSMTVIASLSKNLSVGVFSGLLGVMVSLVGAYEISKGGNGEYRLMIPMLDEELSSGFSLLPVLIGLFAITNMFKELEKSGSSKPQEKINLDQTHPFRFNIFKGHFLTLLRSSGIGTFVGMLPGIGGSAASVLAYTQQKNFSKQPDEMGKGAPEGLIASESANNALTGGALIPLFSLGIPGDSTTAILIAAFTLQGIQIGPLFIEQNMDLWQHMIFTLILANVLMFVILFFSIKQISKLMMIPKHILYPFILLMCVVGAYANNQGVMFDVWTLFIFGLFGYVFQKVGLEMIPFIIGFILGPDAEVYFIKSLESHGSFSIFFTKSPIAMFLWVLLTISLIYSLRKQGRQKLEVKI